jgi:hypothetical protein
MFININTSSSTGRRQKGNYVTVARQPTALQMKGTLLLVLYKLIMALPCVRQKLKYKLNCMVTVRISKEGRKTTRIQVLRHEKGNAVVLLLLLL